MIQAFADLIIKQRMDVLKENLKKIVVPPKKDGQLRITDFASVESAQEQQILSGQQT